MGWVWGDDLVTIRVLEHPRGPTGTRGETDFFDTLTIQSDQISHVKHVLAPFYVFFTLFGGSMVGTD